MMDITTNEEPNVLEVALSTINKLAHQPDIMNRLNELATKTTSLHLFLRLYDDYEKEGLDQDDEILNWTVPVITRELNAALWNLASGFYKTAATCLSSALEMGIVALYFQVLENEKGNQVMSKEFVEWYSYNASTPSWKKVITKLKQDQNIEKFSKQFDYVPLKEVNDLYSYFQDFIRNRNLSSIDTEGANYMNMRNSAGEFSNDEFLRFSDAFDSTIGMIASSWALVYPHIVEGYSHTYSSTSYSTLVDLFQPLYPQFVLYHLNTKSTAGA
ncbi:hypothetical protein [uncultured Pontibacter sp.]|uniref:hypothetical protein n=1 Tax=uncultured Pontibacter sp. TaxID=453356 RepID=UPI0026243B29|nr:hypothetical protein [uncultured Pontibacter sp.]